MPDFGWRVHITDDGTPIVQREPAEAVTTVTTASLVHGFALPAEALDAIAETVKPGPSQGETQRLEQALAVADARIDQVLASFLPGDAE